MTSFKNNFSQYLKHFFSKTSNILFLAGILILLFLIILFILDPQDAINGFKEGFNKGLNGVKE